ncbi:MAG: Asp23/Gls24 family envelope stress response protein, partial [Anaerolineae bacterium]|nr:Asp23/Gls24 family envelope stress response protein [Anaerolineae bacterium]
MSDEVRPPGKTTIAPEVLLTIANLTTLSVEGVSAMSPSPGGVNRLLRKGHQNNGVQIEIEGDRVDANIYVILEKDAQIREVSSTIQREVGRAISEMVGMEVGEINIHIEDFDFET